MQIPDTPKWQPVQIERITADRTGIRADWIQSWISTRSGEIPVLKPHLTLRDRLGFLRMRLGLGRMDYTVPAGVYGLGNPSPDSPVMVTSNFKMTFDILRRDLSGIDCWILVLDTKGINVWCAAGKGTFGTGELLNRINRTRLSDLISHRELILPQLGAVGVAAHEIRKKSGFRVLFGPVYSRDIRLFLDQGKIVTPVMRRVHFNLRERLALIPLEFFPSLKYAPLLLVPAMLKGLILHQDSVLTSFIIDALGLLGAIVMGSVAVPALLPFIPGRAFSGKGAFMGFVFAFIWSLFTHAVWQHWLANMLIYSSVSAYLALNFTGSSTFTSMSGVYREMKRSLPVMIPSLLAGLIIQWF
ncbi:acetyl-CoA synthase subunit gamma [bacterium]|nr:acetyl-CoA synthase subunit gamma [bacterium]